MIRWTLLRDAPYRSTLEQQRHIFSEMVENRRRGLPIDDETIMMVEHLPVYTIGVHGQRTNLIHPEFLKAHGAELVEIERGGDITFHGPGQLVVYPIIDLQRRNLGVKAYVDRLEQAVIDMIASYGITGTRIDGATGVWVEQPCCPPRKICAIGIKCSRFITMHGLALNVSTDLGWFDHINPCGFTDRGVTSIARETGLSDIPFSEAASRLRASLEHYL